MGVSDCPPLRDDVATRPKKVPVWRLATVIQKWVKFKLETVVPSDPAPRPPPD